MLVPFIKCLLCGYQSMFKNEELKIDRESLCVLIDGPHSRVIRRRLDTFTRVFSWALVLLSEESSNLGFPASGDEILLPGILEAKGEGA